jgi:hypothetical protein
MLSVTYLGHAGWLCESEGYSVLVDPLLKADFGRGPSGARMPKIWPPREFAFTEFPALDAVILSHEHEDHLNIPSLNLLDRAIPIYISSRSSVAGRGILKEMGFTVNLLRPGNEVHCGPLRILSFVSNHLAYFNSDEWDGLALAFSDSVDGGSFFTTVDVATTEDMVNRLVARAGQGDCLLLQRREALQWTPVSELHKVMSESTFSLAPEDPDDGYKTLKTGAPLLLRPGMNVTVSCSDLCSFRKSMPFVSVAPLSDWGSQPSWRYHPSNRYFSPACGRTELSEKDIKELETGLGAFAEFLYGTELFKALLSISLDSATGTPTNPTFVFLLFADAQRNHYAFEYDLSGCRFRNVTPQNPFSEYVCGVECWATDLVSLFKGSFEPRILSIGHSRHWSCHQLVPDPFIYAIWPFFHPLRRPKQCLNAYRSQLRSLTEKGHIIRSRQATATTIRNSA